MRYLPAMVMMLVVGLAMLGQSGDAPSAPPSTGQNPVPPSEFMTVDVFVDSGAAALAAWQVEITPRVSTGKAMLVGIEGGDAGAGAAYARPAHYDPAALAPDGGGRVILAAFSTAGAETLPSHRARVARLHVFVEGNGAATFDVKLMVAADPEGRAIEGATASATAHAAAGDKP